MGFSFVQHVEKNCCCDGLRIQVSQGFQEKVIYIITTAISIFEGRKSSHGEDLAHPEPVCLSLLYLLVE